MAARPEPNALQNGTNVDSPTASVSGSALLNGANQFPEIIPDVGEHHGRNLVLCFDGTGDQYDGDNSNIVRFFQLLKKDDRSKQMVYYQAGLGTGAGSSTWTWLRDKVVQVIDQAIATELGAHVRGGYEFLMQNYTEGDRISLFGFSRGAYTARALAGMLQKVGLLPACNHEQVKFAYHMFKRDDEEGWKMSNGFKRAFSIDVKIDFIGVFDTVNSVGLIPRQLPSSKSNHLVRVFRHAVALDEHRAKFRPNMWGRATKDEEKLGEEGRKREFGKPHLHPLPHREGSLNGLLNAIPGDQDVLKRVPGLQKRRFMSAQDWKSETDVKEVWFSGAHCDVGGGSVSNDTANCLARIPLRWMIRECFLNNTGILFHSAELDALGISPTTLWPVVKTSSDTAKLVDTDEASPTSGPASPAKISSTEPTKLAWVEDIKDALCPIYDQLSIAWWWWLLELLPMSDRYQQHDGVWNSRLKVNFGRARKVHGQKRFPTYVHRSVLYRMQQMGYKPRAKLLEEPGPVWVD